MTTSTENEREPRLVFVNALRSAAARPTVWSSSWALIVLLALVGSLPWRAFFGDAFAAEPEGAQMSFLTETFRFDNREELAALEGSSAALGAGLAFVAMLIGCFCAGGWLQVVLERATDRVMRRFFLGGAHFFWRFFRVLLMTLFVLGVGGWVVYGVPWDFVVEGFLLDIDDREELTSEKSAIVLGWFQHGFFALWMALVIVWADYVRARLAMHEARSAVWAGITTVGTLFGNPLRVLRPAALLLLCEFALLWPLSAWARAINVGIGPHTGAGSIWLLFAVVQLALIWRCIIRGAHVYAAVTVGRRIIEPPAKPDPWRNRVGGPGGPQYPIGDDDYGVSF